MEEDIKILEDMLNKERIYKTNRRGIKEIKFEVNSNYYKAIENILNRLKEDEAVIEEMSKMLVKVPISDSDNPMTADVKATINRNLELHKMKVKDYVRYKVKEMGCL